MKTSWPEARGNPNPVFPLGTRLQYSLIPSLYINTATVNNRDGLLWSSIVSQAVLTEESIYPTRCAEVSSGLWSFSFEEKLKIVSQDHQGLDT